MRIFRTCLLSHAVPLLWSFVWVPLATGLCRSTVAWFLRCWFICFQPVSLPCFLLFILTKWFLQTFCSPKPPPHWPTSFLLIIHLPRVQSYLHPPILLLKHLPYFSVFLFTFGLSWDNCTNLGLIFPLSPHPPTSNPKPPVRTKHLWFYPLVISWISHFLNL